MTSVPVASWVQRLVDAQADLLPRRHLALDQVRRDQLAVTVWRMVLFAIP